MSAIRPYGLWRIAHWLRRNPALWALLVLAVMTGQALSPFCASAHAMPQISTAVSHHHSGGHSAPQAACAAACTAPMVFAEPALREFRAVAPHRLMPAEEPALEARFPALPSPPPKAKF